MQVQGTLVHIYLLLPDELRPWDEESQSRQRTITCYVAPKRCLTEFKTLIVGLRPRYASLAFHENDQWFIWILNEGIKEVGEIKL